MVRLLLPRPFGRLDVRRSQLFRSNGSHGVAACGACPELVEGSVSNRSDLALPARARRTPARREEELKHEGTKAGSRRNIADVPLGLSPPRTLPSCTARPAGPHSSGRDRAPHPTTA